MDSRILILIVVCISLSIITLVLGNRANPSLKINPSALIIDSVSSVFRMFAALAISFLTALLVGITAARKQNVAKIIIPIVDILQSVPILGFFPAAITFFIALFGGSLIGVEIAAVFLIFTSMVWNMIFAVYESVLSIPTQLLETTQAYRANPFLQFRKLFLPASMSKLIYNSILSWAAGWYFLTAAEIISLGSKTYTLQGLGSLLSTSVSAGEYLQSVLAIFLLVSIIMITDFFFWRPLESYATRFKYDYSPSSFTEGPAQKESIQQFGLFLRDQALAKIFLRKKTFPPIHFSNFFPMYPRPLIHIKSSQFVVILLKLVSKIELAIIPLLNRILEFSNKRNLRVITFLIAIVSIAALVFGPAAILISKSMFTLYNMYFSLFHSPGNNKFISQIPLALLLSYIRLLIAYLMTLAWAIPVAIKIAHSAHFAKLMPVFQTVAAIPATAFFPFVAALIPLIPGGLEFPSILLILTGMQWYVLFNLIGGVRSISSDLEEVAKAFRVDEGLYNKHVLFPSVYPSLITGSITGWGGGWNSLIVAEYLVFGNKVYFVLGMGSLIDFAAYNLGNTVLLLMLVGLMASVVVITNKLIWRRLYSTVVKKYSMSS
jgi:NitT/TauT family transport system permease protein